MNRKSFYILSILDYSPMHSTTMLHHFQCKLHRNLGIHLHSFALVRALTPALALAPTFALTLELVHTKKCH